jgi:hypothetical protein
MRRYSSQSLDQTSPISQEDYAITDRYLDHQPKAEKKRSQRRKRSHLSKQSQERNSLLGALASTASGVVGERASGANGLAALADVVADIVVTTTDLTVNCSIIFWTTNTVEVGSLGLLAGDRVDVAALGKRDLAVVAGTLATDLYFGTGELLLDGLVDAGLNG